MTSAKIDLVTLPSEVARLEQLAVEQSRADETEHRRLRDLAVRAAWSTEPGWTYESLAAAVGCSKELIAKIVKGWTL